MYVSKSTRSGEPPPPDLADRGETGRVMERGRFLGDGDLSCCLCPTLLAPEAALLEAPALLPRCTGGGFFSLGAL
jgi:hypothetical protein